MRELFSTPPDVQSAAEKPRHLLISTNFGTTHPIFGGKITAPKTEKIVWPYPIGYQIPFLKDKWKPFGRDNRVSRDEVSEFLLFVPQELKILILCKEHIEYKMHYETYWGESVAKFLHTDSVHVRMREEMKEPQHTHTSATHTHIHTHIGHSWAFFLQLGLANRKDLSQEKSFSLKKRACEHRKHVRMPFV